MSLEKILEKIIDDARAEADNVISENKKKAEEIIEAAKNEASDLGVSVIEETERKALLEASRLVTQARLEKRISILSQKKKIIDEILKKALQKADFGRKELKKEIVLKDGVREESYGWEKLSEELRPKLEKYILEFLKI